MVRFGLLFLALSMLPGKTAARKQPACGDIPLLKAAMSQLPDDLRFPCDPEHLIVIRDLRAFLQDHPDIAADGNLRWKAEHAMAFTVGASWPVYINLTSHRTLPDAYDRGLVWIACVFAGVLAHERIHALGDPSEAMGLAAELSLAKRFHAAGKLPADFDVAGLERQWRDAAAAEKPVTKRE